MELKSTKDAFDRVANKQKLSYSKTHEIVQMLSQEIEKALSIIQNSQPDTLLDHRSILADVKTMVMEIAPINQLEAVEKELHMALTKYPKVLEKQLNPDISKAYRNNVEFDTHIVNQIIANFFYDDATGQSGREFNKTASKKQKRIVLHYLIDRLWLPLQVRLSMRWRKRNGENADVDEELEDFVIKNVSLNTIEDNVAIGSDDGEQQHEMKNESRIQRLVRSQKAIRVSLNLMMNCMRLTS